MAIGFAKRPYDEPDISDLDNVLGAIQKALDRVADHAGPYASESYQDRVRWMLGKLERAAFMLHGEHRDDGLTEHRIFNWPWIGGIYPGCKPGFLFTSDAPVGIRDDSDTFFSEEEDFTIQEFKNT